MIYKKKLRKILLIYGLTGSGKSDISVNIAKKINGIIINADSMQIYREIKILSARPKLYSKVPHYLYGVISVKKKFSSGEWLRQVQRIIKRIPKNKLIIFTGGTGLYFKFLIDGISNIPLIPWKIRDRVKKLNEKLGNIKFHKKLLNLDPKIKDNIHRNDTQRLIRAYEVKLYTKKSIIDFQKNNKFFVKNFNFIKIFLKSEKEILYKNLRFRLKKMFENGAIEEVKYFKSLKVKKELSSNFILGVKEILNYLNRKVTLEEAFELTFIRTKKYVKRQLTWFRGKMKDWIEIPSANKSIAVNKIIKIISST